MRDLTPDRFRMACEAQAVADAEARRAHRPPEAPIPTLASWAGTESLSKVVEMFRIEVDARCRLEREAAAREDTMSILIEELQSEQSTKRLLMWIGGSVLVVETLALVVFLWHIWGAE